MNIEKDIKWIHQEIDKIKNPLTIKKLKNLIESINYPIINSTDNYNIDIGNSLKSIKKGKIYTEDQAKKNHISKRNIIQYKNGKSNSRSKNLRESQLYRQKNKQSGV